MIRTRSICKRCGEVKPRKDFTINKTTGYLRGECKICSRKKVEKLKLTNGTYVYRKEKKDYCEVCGFIGHPCQLDVNHKDMNHKNNKLENLETLCVNCHRLVTYLQRKK